MFRLVLLTALCAVLTSVQAGPRCTKCNQARDDEETCNNQEGMEPHYVDCADDEVCTTDVRCDGQGRLFFIKGCQKNPSAMDTLICNPEKTRCHYHCDMDMCNENAPPEVWESLKCYDDSRPETTTPSTITEYFVDCPPVEVCFVLDMSTSINDHDPSNWNIELLFVKTLIGGLPVAEDGVRVGIVRFAGPDDTHKDRDMSPGTNNKADLLALISTLPYEPTSTGTKTNLGIAACCEILEDNGLEDAMRNVVIVTDGQTSEPEGTREEIQKLRDLGIRSFPVGVGDVNEEGMETLSTEEPPVWFHIGEFESLVAIREALTHIVC